jgi:hypothetical protein
VKAIIGPVIIAVVSIVLSSPLLHPRPSAAQGAPGYNGAVLPLSPGKTGSEARGIAERGWAPLTIVGTMEDSIPTASCWIQDAQQWTAHELPGLHPGAPSWANAVDHVAWSGGEWTLVVGAAICSTGTPRPMRWDNVKNTPWNANPLSTWTGGHGEAYGLFLPDGTPVRALICGWVDESPPVDVVSIACTIGLRTVEIWEVTPTGERLMRPPFGAGLESYANDIASSGPGVLFVVGSGDGGGGVWKPQLWTSQDDGETWSNEELPLPLGVDGGEVVDCDHENGHWLGAGFGVTTSGITVPLLWDLDTGAAGGAWVVHQLPLPAADEGGVNASVHKRPGRTTYASIILKSGLTSEVGIWIDDDTGGWMLYEAADYLLNPGIGTPVAPSGVDGYGRIAVKFPTLPATASSAAATQTGTVAGVLIPEPATDAGQSTPRLIALTAAPNPFASGVRIGYTSPRDAPVTVTIHDVAGRVVATLERGTAVAGRERVVRWDGTSHSGRRAASGVYFVRVETPHEIATTKIVRLH